MKVLIVGGGIAGLTLAYWLNQHGHTPVVIEKAPTIRTQGYVLDFTGTGYDVADRMGILSALRKRAYPAEGIVYKNAKNEDIARISVHKLLQAASDEARLLVLNRRDLVLTLYETIQDRVEVCFDTHIQAIAQDEHGVRATLASGAVIEADILVGCDGIHSTVRQLVMGEETQFTHHLGYQFAIFNIPPLKGVDFGKDYAMYVEPGLQMSLYPAQSDQWLVFCMYENLSSNVPPQDHRLAALKQRLAGVEWLVPQIFAKLDEHTPIFMDTVTQIKMPTWSKGRVMMIGDAAACPTLLSGQGASMAMAGAYFLGMNLANDYAQAFRAVDDALREHINKIQASAERIAPSFVPRSRLRIWIVNLVLHLADIPYFRGIIGKQFTINSILE